METKKLQKLTLGELRTECTKEGIEFTDKDTRAVLIAKLSEDRSHKVKNAGGIASVQERFKKKVKIIVTRMNPEDSRDSYMHTIINQYGTFRFPITFNKEIEVPEPFVKSLEEITYQGYRKVTTKMGVFDEAFTAPAFIVKVMG